VYLQSSGARLLLRFVRYRPPSSSKSSSTARMFLRVSTMRIPSGPYNSLVPIGVQLKNKMTPRQHSSTKPVTHARMIMCVLNEPSMYSSPSRHGSSRRPEPPPPPSRIAKLVRCGVVPQSTPRFVDLRHTS